MLGVAGPADTTATVGAVADAVWWSDGSRARAAGPHGVCGSLPDAATYAAMLGAPTADVELGETQWESTS